MHSVLPYQPGTISPVHSPVSPFDAAPGLPPQALPPRPHLEVYTGDTGSVPCELPTPSSGEDEYYVRDMFSSSPSSSSPYGDSHSPLPSYPDPYLDSPSTFMPTTSSACHPSSVAPSRRGARRASEPACLDDGLVVKGSIAHPYARLYSKKHGAGKRRKMWNHALEKMLFSPQEISTMGAPHRRTIYTASLEAHVDGLHEQLLNLSLAPVPFEKLEPYRGLNAKTAKSMVSGLHHDASELKLKILEIERANAALEEKLNASHFQ